jgi:hypothetical protein
MKNTNNLIYVIAAILMIVGVIFKIQHYSSAYLLMFLGFIVGGFADRLEIRILKKRIKELEEMG